MGVKVIVASENDINQCRGKILRQFMIIWLALMGDGNDQICAIFSELFRKFLSCLRCRLIDQIRWKRIDRIEPVSRVSEQSSTRGHSDKYIPFPLAKTQNTNLESI